MKPSFPACRNAAAAFMLFLRHFQQAFINSATEKEGILHLRALNRCF